MNLYLFDTSTLSHYLRDQPVVMRRVFEHLADDIATVTVIADEAIGGWLDLVKHGRSPEQIELASRRLADTIRVLGGWDIYPLTAAALRGVRHLNRRRLNVGLNDFRIAAVALELNATVVTANVRDFARVPGLRVEDWSI